MRSYASSFISSHDDPRCGRCRRVGCQIFRAVPRRDVITAYERASHRFDDTRLIGADNLYAALIRRYFQVALRRRSYAERARDGVRRVECNLAGNPWQCACTGYARTAAKRDCTTCRARVRVGRLRRKTAISFPIFLYISLSLIERLPIGLDDLY